MIRVLVRNCGRSDDGREAVLRQDVRAASCFRWPDPDQQFYGRATGLLTITPGRKFAVIVANGLVFFRSDEHELCLHFRLLPVLPARVDIDIDLLPSEVDEGTEFSSPPPRPLAKPPQQEVTPQ